VSDDLRQAVEYAAWWTRKALDLAAGEPDAHPGLVGHLTAADVQHRAAERLIPANGNHPGPSTTVETTASAAQPQSIAA